MEISMARPPAAEPTATERFSNCRLRECWTTLYSFNAQSFIDTALVEGNDGNFYGVTENGGKPVKGTVFQVTPQGALKTLHTFQGAGRLWRPTAR